MPAGVPARWRKKHNGQIYYYRGDYNSAVKQWHKQQAELEAEETEATYHRKQWEKVRQWYASQGQSEDAERVATDILSKDDAFCKMNWLGMPSDSRSVWAERFRAMEEPAQVAKTINQAVEAFLARQLVKAETGAISAGYYDNLQRSVNAFADHAGRRLSVEGITGSALESFHSSLLQHKEWSSDYTASRIRHALTFVNWCYDVELLAELPRIMRRGGAGLRITTETSRKKPNFANEEVEVILAHASERTCLYLLLMANCGYTQIDLSDLRPDQVDWTTGRITRKRSKTKDSENVPQVSYPLWHRTFSLLLKYGHQDGERVLTNERGEALRVDTLRKGKLVKVDNIAVSYSRLCDKLMKQGKLKTKKSLKTFRKTSPSRLEDSEYASCARWFGGWSPRSVADRHYIRPPQEMFDRAVAWLEKSYGLG
jgi:integrase